MPNDDVVNNPTEPQGEPVADPVTDDILSAAYDALFSDDTITEPVETPPVQVEPVVEPVVEPEPTEPEPPLTHEESSRLGRKVADLSKNMVTKEEFNSIMQKLDELSKRPLPSNDSLTPTNPLTPAEQDEINDITDVTELDAYLDRREQRKAKAEAEKIENYRKGYISTLREYSKDVDSETFGKVFDKMKGKYNDVITGNPESDCAKNFIQAFKEVNAEARTAPVTPFDKNKGVDLTVPTTPQSINAPQIAMPQLDPIAAEFVKRTGMSAEAVKSVLEGEIKANLIGTKKVL